MQFDFIGKVAVLCGGTVGMGYAAAELFGKSGAKVAICARSENKVKEAVEKLTAQGIDAIGEICDVSDTKQIFAFADKVEEAFGKIDIWVSNAGYMPFSLIKDIDDELYDKIINTNLKSVFNGGKIAYEKMRENGGVLINASSFSTVIPSIGFGLYAAAKAGVSSLTRTLAAELAPYNIRVVGYIPGVIDTDLTKEMQRINGDKLVEALAIRRLGDPEDVAGLIAFLASDAAKYITGTCVEATGGKFAVQNAMKAYEFAGKL